MTTSKLKLVFMGTPFFSVPALQFLIAGIEKNELPFEIALVVTQPDRPAGRGQKLTPPPVKQHAERVGLPVVQTQSIRKDEALQARLRELQPDVFVTIAFGQILSQEVLELPRLGTVNVHASLLPRWRGANPIQHAILAGDTTTGLTTMLTELGVDTGPLLLKDELTIEPNENAVQLTERLSQQAGPLLAKTLMGLADGSVTPTPQDDALAVHAGKLSKDDAVIDWQQPAQTVHNRIRGQQPSPGAVTFLGDKRLKLIASRVATNEEIVNNPVKSQPAGTIETGNTPMKGILVHCGEQTALVLEVVQPESKPPMNARDWARGTLKGETAQFTAEAAQLSTTR